jgi:hypothetical protein
MREFMNGLDSHNKGREKDRREFPPGLFLLGLLVVILAWLTLLGPDLPAFLSPEAVPPTQPSQIATSQDSNQPVPPAVPAAAQNAPTSETPANPMEPAAPKAGDFCRYTDENGVIHLVNDPAKVPERFRPGIEVVALGRGTSATQVECRGNRVLVPVTLRYRGKELRTTLLLDTGATLTTINESVALRLGKPAGSGLTFCHSFREFQNFLSPLDVIGTPV